MAFIIQCAITPDPATVRHLPVVALVSRRSYYNHILRGTPGDILTRELGPKRMARSPSPHQNDWAVRSLREAIDADGRGVKRFAREVLVRPPSTIYRWLSGSRPVPKCVRDFLIGEWRILDPPTIATTTEGGHSDDE